MRVAIIGGAPVHYGGMAFQDGAAGACYAFNHAGHPLHLPPRPPARAAGARYAPDHWLSVDLRPGGGGVMLQK